MRAIPRKESEPMLSGSRSDLQTVEVGWMELPLLIHQGQRVITLKTMDEAHHRPSGTARRAFNAQKHQLVEGDDYFVRTPYEATEFRIIAPSGLVLLTKSGYQLLAERFTGAIGGEAWHALSAYFHDGSGSSTQEMNDNWMVSAAADVSRGAEMVVGAFKGASDE